MHITKETSNALTPKQKADQAAKCSAKVAFQFASFSMSNGNKPARLTSDSTVADIVASNMTRASSSDTLSRIQANEISRPGSYLGSIPGTPIESSLVVSALNSAATSATSLSAAAKKMIDNWQ